MADPFRILGIAGSLRRDSHNGAVLRAASELLPDGAALETYDELGLLPHYNEDDDTGERPAAVREFYERVAAVDALLVVTPEYNGSVPGVLKNALDWASRPYGSSVLMAKPALVIGASTSPFAAAWAREHARKALQLSGARPYESGYGVGKVDTKRSASGVFEDATDLDALRELFASFVAGSLLPVPDDDF